MKKLTVLQLLATALFFVVSLTSTLHAARVVGLSIFTGAGLSFPMGDLANENKYRATTGFSWPGLEIEAFPKQEFSIGGFFSGDFPHVRDNIVLLDTLPLMIDNLVVGDVGFVLKYYLSSTARWQPYSKLQYGWSWLTINTKNSGASSDLAQMFAVGGGVMFLPSSHIGFSLDLMYKKSSIADNGGGEYTLRVGQNNETTNRISLSLILIFLIG